MILSVADFTGHFRLPNARPADAEDAIREADVSLLREVFAEDTVAFVISAPSDPPASTLRQGAGGLYLAWRDVALWYAQYRIAFGIAGQGAPVAEGTHRPVAFVPQAYAAVERLRQELRRISSAVWQGRAVYVSSTATTTTFQLPTVAAEWLRAGSPLRLFADAVYQAQVVSITLPDLVEVDVVLAQDAGYQIAYNLKPSTDIWTWLKS